MASSSNLIVTRKIKIKNTAAFQNISIRWLKKRLTIVSMIKICVATGTFLHHWWEYKMAWTLCKIVFQFLNNKHTFTQQLSNSTLRYWLPNWKHLSTQTHQKTNSCSSLLCSLYSTPNEHCSDVYAPELWCLNEWTTDTHTITWMSLKKLGWKRKAGKKFHTSKLHLFVRKTNVS